MKKSLSILLGVACILTIYSCRNSGTENNDSEVLESKPTEIKQEVRKKETSTLFLPIGGFTPGFLYCGFDGDKSKLSEMTDNGWQIVSFNSQNFQTSKRNGDPVSCNGNLYILERDK
tara:strand:+ start:111 stop:461 length:351 start_codon:yes stop_codon:yes gene_type:complete